MYMNIFEDKGMGVKYKIVCFVSANYRGGFFIRHNLSIYAEEVKNSFGNAWERCKKKKMKGGKLPAVILLTGLFRSLSILLKEWLLV